MLNLTENSKDYGIPIIKSDSYTISYNRTPEIQSLFVDSSEGLINTKVKIDERGTDSSTLVFMSSESKYHSNFRVENEELDSFYIKSMNGSINSMNGEFASKKEISYLGHRGLEFYATLYEGQVRCCYRIFLINDTLYSIGILYTNSQPDEEGLRFMDSFKLIKN